MNILISTSNDAGAFLSERNIHTSKINNIKEFELFCDINFYVFKVQRQRITNSELFDLFGDPIFKYEDAGMHQYTLVLNNKNGRHFVFYSKICFFDEDDFIACRLKFG